MTARQAADPAPVVTRPARTTLQLYWQIVFHAQHPTGLDVWATYAEDALAHTPELVLRPRPELADRAPDKGVVRVSADTVYRGAARILGGQRAAVPPVPGLDGETRAMLSLAMGDMDAAVMTPRACAQVIQVGVFGAVLFDVAGGGR